jgi:hypothetical protein
MDRFVDETGLKTTAIRPVNIFHICTMVVSRNNKQDFFGVAVSVCTAL